MQERNEVGSESKIAIYGGYHKRLKIPILAAPIVVIVRL